MKKSIGLILLALLCLAGCAPFLAPPPAPTLAPGKLNTIVAQTANAAATQTALVYTPTTIPTTTLRITTTPSEVPSITPTFIFILSSPTRPSPTSEASLDDGGNFACKILDQHPQDNTVFAPEVDFETRWQVQNTGSRLWDQNGVDYRYVSGDHLHKQAIYDLYKDVPVGGMADIIVKMISPDHKGTYSTTWRLRVGQNAFCTMKLTIVVR